MASDTIIRSKMALALDSFDVDNFVASYKEWRTFTLEDFPNDKDNIRRTLEMIKTLIKNKGKTITLEDTEVFNFIEGFLSKIDEDPMEKQYQKMFFKFHVMNSNKLPYEDIKAHLGQMKDVCPFYRKNEISELGLELAMAYGQMEDVKTILNEIEA